MRLYVSKFFMFLLFLLMFIQPVQARAYLDFQDDAMVCTNATTKFEKEYQIKQHLLTTISSVETGRWNEEQGRNLAWPWTINAQGKGMFFPTKEQAIKKVQELQASGVKSIDVGCMQINLMYHGDAFTSIEDAFNPEKNVEYAAKFLTSLYKRKGNDWLQAATAYHSNTPKKADYYKKKLLAAFALVENAFSKDNSQKVAITTKPTAQEIASSTLSAQAQVPAQKPEVKPEAKTVAQVSKARAKKPASTRQIAANKANAWREAKLLAWNESKNKSF